MGSVIEVFDDIYKDIVVTKQADTPIIIGINGIDTSGKTKFAKNLKRYLENLKHKVQLIHIDDFHNPKEIRYSGKDEVYNYLHKSFNIKRLVEDILIPIKTNKVLYEKFKLLNLATDKFDIEKQYDVDKDTFIILEGVFILTEEIEPYLDYKIFIHIPFQQCEARAIERDVPLYGDEVLKKYRTKYIPTQKLYLEKYPPQNYVDIIIENSDWNNPRIIFRK